MDFLSSIRQLSLHLTKIERNNFTDDDLLDTDRKNLSSSLAEGDPCLDEPSVNNFFLKFQQMMESPGRNPKSFKQLLTILEELVENPRVRKHLRERGFISLLSHILQSEGVNSQILGILVILTKDLRIEWQEPYLTTLIPLLVDTITIDEQEISRMCLQILVNLCQSHSAVDTLYKLCNTKDLHKKLNENSFGFLSIKMFYIMDVHFKNTEHFHITLVAVFGEIEELLVKEEAEACQECFQFVQEFALEALEVCREGFEKYLTSLLEKLKDLQSERESKIQAFVIPGLRLFSSLIQDNNSLETLYESLLDFALDNLNHVEALHLLRILGEKNFKLGSAPVDRLAGMWVDLAGCLNEDVPGEKCLSALRLLHVFVQNPQHQASILGAVKCSYLRRLLETPAEVIVEDLTDEQILLILESLDLLNTFATVEPQGWYGQADEALKSPKMVDIIAEGFARRSQEMFTCCLNLAKITNFPTHRITGLLYGSPYKNRLVARQSPPEETYASLQVLKQQTSMINEILKQFTENPADLTTSSAAFLLKHHDMYEQEMRKFQEQQIEEGRRHVAFLQRQISSLETERRSMRSLLCQNDISAEKSRFQIAECEKTIEQLQYSISQMHNKIKNYAEEREEARKALEAKTEECEELRRVYREFKDTMKETLKAVKEEKQQEIKGKEYLQKIIDEMKKEATRKNTRIQHLEDQVKEKDALKQKIANFMNGL